MLRFEKVERFYGTHEVLTGVNWSIPARSRVGLVGPNGAGKSTLLRLLAGIEEPDRGVIVRPRGTELGYLPQEGARVVEGTLLEAILAPFSRVRAMEHELMIMHEAMATARGEELERLTRESGELQHRFEVAGGFELESRARAILTGLGFAAEDANRPLAEFSGGFRMRAALGALLLKSPDYILLDEPTNHLDLDGIVWLETHLQQITSALIIVSHDRMFLNRLVRSIADLDRGKVKVWTGNYDSFRAQKASAREQALKQAIQEERRRAEVERFIERFRYKATKARQVQSRIKMLEKMKATEVPVGDPEWQFRFPSVPARQSGFCCSPMWCARSTAGRYCADSTWRSGAASGWHCAGRTVVARRHSSSSSPEICRPTRDASKPEATSSCTISPSTCWRP